MSKEKKEKLFSGTYWQDILLEIYKHAPDAYGIGRTTGNPLLEKRVNVSTKYLTKSVQFLEEQNLIQVPGLTNEAGDIDLSDEIKAPMFLRPDGFKVAMNLEKHRDQIKLNNVLLAFTCIIAWTGIFELLRNIHELDPLFSLILYSGVIFLIGIFTILNVFLKNKFEKIRKK
jgi:hypothetical protein